MFGQYLVIVAPPGSVINKHYHECTLLYRDANQSQVQKRFCQLKKRFSGEKTDSNRKIYQIPCDFNKCSENNEIVVYSNHNYDYSVVLYMK